jgi:hypothetical protein
MKNVVLFSLLLCTAGVSAQSKKLSFGLSSSFDWNSYALVDNDEYKGRPGFSAGPFVRITLSDRITLDGGVNYSTKSFRYEDSFRIIDPNDPLLESEEIQVDYHHAFLDIPVEINMALNEHNWFTFYASGGVISSILVHDKIKSNMDLGDDFIVGRTPYKNYLLSGKVGMGFLAELEKVAFSIEPQLRCYITDVDKYRDQRPVHFGIEVSILKL